MPPTKQRSNFAMCLTEFGWLFNESQERCAPTRNSPCHCLLGGLTQGQGVCAAGWLSHSHSLVQRGPITDHIVHRFASEVIPESHPGLRRWHMTAIIGITVHRAARPPCDVACAVKFSSMLIIVEHVGVKRCEYPYSILFPEVSTEPCLRKANLQTDEFYLLVD